MESGLRLFGFDPEEVKEVMEVMEVMEVLEVLEVKQVGARGSIIYLGQSGLRQCLETEPGGTLTVATTGRTETESGQLCPDCCEGKSPLVLCSEVESSVELSNCKTSTNSTRQILGCSYPQTVQSFLSSV